LPPRPLGVGEFNFDDDKGVVDFEDSVRDGHSTPGTVVIQDGGRGTEVNTVD
jgi:hypothetical protein